MFQNLVDIIAAPSAAFARIKEKPTIWAPLLLILVFTVSAQLGYFLLNDPGFVKDAMVEQATANPDLSQEQRNAIEARFENLNVKTIAISSSVAVVIFVPLILA